MTSPALSTTALDLLAPHQALAVRQLADAAPDSQNNPPISERGLLHLQSGAPFRHFVTTQDGLITGYAQLDPVGDHVSAELVTAVPDAHDTAGRLLAHVSTAAEGEKLLLWAHGSDSAGNRAALQAGWLPVRSLHQMRRSLTDWDTPDPEPGQGVLIRQFVPGQDDAAWLAVNARAFASHPEQGGWTQADLTDRMESDWFDPTGFLLADRGGELLGYHWTKVHSNTGEPIGEVYVLGVDPAAQGMKLGHVLLTRGLNHLKAQGLGGVLLYADATNTTAVSLYEKLGFAIFSTDIQYARP